MTTLLIQAAALSFGAHTIEWGLAAIFAINVWQVRATLAFRDEARTLRQWAFGPEGNNGANSTIKSHGDRLDDLESELPHVHKRRTDR